MVEDYRYIEGKNAAVGVAYSQGRRDYMQDCPSVKLECELDPDVDFFGVYDGHGVYGERVSKHLADQLGDFVLQKLYDDDYKNVETVIQDAFVEFDYEMSNLKLLMGRDGQLYGGSTAVCIWIRKNTIISANAGDSRAVMSINGKAIPMTFDHKPRDPIERNRIVKAGGYVQIDRVQGVLAVSRAFGDFAFKRARGVKLSNQMVTALPDVRFFKMEKDLEFIIMGSDGVWDCLTNQQAVDIIWKMIRQKTSLGQIANSLMKLCIAKPGSLSPIGKDNVTVIIIIPLKETA